MLTASGGSRNSILEELREEFQLRGKGYPILKLILYKTLHKIKKVSTVYQKIGEELTNTDGEQLKSPSGTNTA